MVNTMVATVEAILDAPPDDQLAEQDITITAEKQLRLIVLAIPHWHNATSSAPYDDRASPAVRADAGAM